MATMCVDGLRKSGIRGFIQSGGGGGDFTEEQTDWWRLRKRGGLINMAKFDMPKALIKLSFMA